MTASQIGYAPVHRWVKGVLAGEHLMVVQTIAWAVLCLLVAQHVTPAKLARALPAEASGSGRSGLQRVHRWWRGPAVEMGRVTPRLVRVALALVPGDQAVVIALDTTRVGGWEVWLAGIVFAGRTLPVAWAVVPYPWPKGRFRATTVALIEQLQSAFPSAQRWRLVADRGFPSPALFAQLRQGQTDWTVRLRLNSRVTIAGVTATVRAQLEAGRLEPGQRVEATVGRGTAAEPEVTAWVVVTDEAPPPPKHKGNSGTERERAQRAKARAQHLAHKGRKVRPPSAAAQRYARTWVLFTTAPTVAAAATEYAMRMRIEETFRDWHHHWGVRRAAATLPTDSTVGRLVGTVSVAYVLQLALGWRLSRDAVGQRRQAQWTVTGRVSLFWSGQQLFADPGYDWRSWLAEQWEHLPTPDHAPAMPIEQAA